MTIPGFILLVLGTPIATINFYASFLSYPLHRLRGRPRESYHFESGVPLLGALLLWISAPFLWSTPELFWPVIGLSILDTGGFHWFIAMMIWMEVIEPRRKRRG